ncbi:hypothetical protein C8Q80DRAFT_404802 [Daedaleopsis nitida]|nr:hypothetical protein C8Q80DRAFT_404802 [Daedaleopsis nitida]
MCSTRSYRTSGPKMEGSRSRTSRVFMRWLDPSTNTTTNSVKLLPSSRGYPQDPQLLRLCPRRWLPMALDRYVLHRQDEQCRAIGGLPLRQRVRGSRAARLCLPSQRVVQAGLDSPGVARASYRSVPFQGVAHRRHEGEHGKHRRGCDRHLPGDARAQEVFRRRLRREQDVLGFEAQDEAYSLMGIFGVNMPVIYGEGRETFIRLQEGDPQNQTLLVWGRCLADGDAFLDPERTLQSSERSEDRYLLAPSSSAFRGIEEVVPIDGHTLSRKLSIRLKIPAPTFTVTPHGIRALVPVLEWTGYIRMVVLACEHTASEELAILLLARSKSSASSLGSITPMTIASSMASFAGRRPSGRPSTSEASVSV